MALKITRVDTWAATIEDRPGGLARKLRGLAEGGANLEMVIARRSPERPGQGVVFVAPIKGVKQSRAAVAAGFSKADALHTLRAEGPDKPGLGARITQALAEAGVNLRGLSAAALGKECVVYVAIGTANDAAAATAAMKRIR